MTGRWDMVVSLARRCRTGALATAVINDRSATSPIDLESVTRPMPDGPLGGMIVDADARRLPSDGCVNGEVLSPIGGGFLAGGSPLMPIGAFDEAFG